MTKKSKLMHVDYHHYIKSVEWREKHKFWLLESGYRCSMFPWIQCGKGKRYRIHHLPEGYENLGNEVLWEHVIVLSPFAHDWIIHGILSGFKSAGKQNPPYPNKAQDLVHGWCLLPVWVKVVVMSAIAFLIGWIGIGSLPR